MESSEPPISTTEVTASNPPRTEVRLSPDAAGFLKSADYYAKEAIRTQEKGYSYDANSLRVRVAITRARLGGDIEESVQAISDLNSNRDRANALAEIGLIAAQRDQDPTAIFEQAIAHAAMIEGGPLKSRTEQLENAYRGKAQVVDRIVDRLLVLGKADLAKKAALQIPEGSDDSDFGRRDRRALALIRIDDAEKSNPDDEAKSDSDQEDASFTPLSEDEARKAKAGFKTEFDKIYGIRGVDKKSDAAAKLAITQTKIGELENAKKAIPHIRSYLRRASTYLEMAKIANQLPPKAA